MKTSIIAVLRSSALGKSPMMIRMLAGIIMTLPCIADAQDRQKTFPIWPGAAPGSEGRMRKEMDFLDAPSKEVYVRNVVTPTLTAHLPDPAKATGTAIIVVPGGGFSFLWESDATQDAEWLAAKGVSAFVLKHRLIDTGETEEEFKRSMDRHLKLMMVLADAANRGEALPALDRELVKAIGLGIEDGRQAIRYLRKDAKAWGIRPDRVGVMGLSSGGLVAMGAAIEHDPESRPDFIAPIYTPWFLEAAKEPPGAAPTFIGAKVPPDAPPAFIAVASDDFIAVPGSLLIYGAWRRAGRAAELHAYSEGGHGFGVKPRGLTVDNWLKQFVDWLNVQDRARR
jgi:acetyl esterase/lipase